MKGFGISCKVVIKGNASAALGTIGRRRLGKVRHIDAGHLWTQELSADLMIKAPWAIIAHEHMEAIGEIPAAGRSHLAASADLGVDDQTRNNNGGRGGTDIAHLLVGLAQSGSDGMGGAGCIGASGW